MKAVILAGGLGSRISEESHLRRKPMIEIGGKPLLWHIMKIYEQHGCSDFVVCCGYKSYVIKEYFRNYFLHTSDVTFDLRSNRMEIHRQTTEPWTVTLVDTGTDTLTGGRLKRVREFLNPGEPFCFTYGDGVADIDIAGEVAFHNKHGKLATICAVQPPGRYGALLLDGSSVSGFREKPPGDGAWINGGFFVLQPEAVDFVDGDDSSFESETLPRLAEAGQLEAWQHRGFWQAMDTLRERNVLEELWDSGQAPWKSWA